MLSCRLLHNHDCVKLPFTGLRTLYAELHQTKIVSHVIMISFLFGKYNPIFRKVREAC